MKHEMENRNRRLRLAKKWMDRGRIAQQRRILDKWAGLGFFGRVVAASKESSSE